jgi:chromosome segregation ATPase
MRRTIAVLGVILGTLGTAAAWHGAVSAQSRQPPNDQEVLPALLTEVRGLRAAMEQMASAGPRVQLALGRLQLQEQRVNNVVRRLDAVRATLLESQGNYERSQQQMTKVEEATPEELPAGMQGTAQVKEMRAFQVKEMQAQMKIEMARIAADVQRLTVEESALSAELAAEQGRWTDLNGQMEALERALIRK